jgi:hypothetical protein
VHGVSNNDNDNNNNNDNMREREHLDDPGVDGMIILRWILKKWGGVWTGSSWPRAWKGGGLL